MKNNLKNKIYQKILLTLKSSLFLSEKKFLERIFYRTYYFYFKIENILKDKIISRIFKN
jgi:hypothetical protein